MTLREMRCVTSKHWWDFGGDPDHVMAGSGFELLGRGLCCSSAYWFSNGLISAWKHISLERQRYNKKL